MFKPHIHVCKRECLILILIIALASIVRLWDLGGVGFNTDEAVYAGQSATLGGFEQFEKFFSIYRAHPLLLQFITSLLFVGFGISDTVARVVPAILGIITVPMVYFIGKELYNKRVSMFAALMMAIIPYNIIVSRQVLIDVSLSLFSTLTLYFILRYVKNNRGSHWLYLIGASSGLSFLSKEVGIFALIASLVTLLLTRRLSSKGIVIIVSSFLLASSPFWFPILTIQEAQQTALSYWQWQTNRDQNQPDTFYLSVIFKDALGYTFAGAFIVSIVYLIYTGNIKRPEILVLLVWLVIPLLMFQFLPIKGYHFVMSLVPSFVLLGVSILDSEWIKKVPHHRIVLLAFVPLVLLTTGPVLGYMFQDPSPPLAGSGGIPHVREAAIWMRDNIPEDHIMLTLDAPTANIIKFYSNIEAFSLHSNKNPAYAEIVNADLYIMSGQVHYLVSQPNIVEVSPHLKDELKKINNLVIKYNGVPIHTEYETHVEKNGQILIRPAIIIYSLEEILGE